MSCIFCEIIAGNIPSKKVYEDERVIAIHDIHPQAPVHILIIPKMHIPSTQEITDENALTVAAIFTAVSKIARVLGVSSYRIINNCGADAGQSVLHLHFHLLAGKTFGETF